MMCQNCGKNPATTHIKTIVNGKLAEYDLCSECARAKRLQNFFDFDDMDFYFNNLLGSFIRCADPGAVMRYALPEMQCFALRRLQKAARSAAQSVTMCSVTA